jgi:prophage antirepressor-like protein
MSSYSNPSVQIFKSTQFGEIRTTGTSEQPLFCLADVCNSLKLKNVSDCRCRLNEKGVVITDTLTSGGLQSMIFINESNLYKCIFQSRKKEAQMFQDWVSDEILPAIRKTGGYIASSQNDTPELIMARALQVAQVTIENHKQRLQMLSGENELLQQENKALAPKAEYTDKVLQSTSTYTMTQIAKEMGMSAISLERKLHERKIMFSQSGQWFLYEKYQDKGYTKPRTHHYYKSDGTTGSKTITVFTERGRAFLHYIFENQLQTSKN